MTERNWGRVLATVRPLFHISGVGKRQRTDPSFKPPRGEAPGPNMEPLSNLMGTRSAPKTEPWLETRDGWPTFHLLVEPCEYPFS